MSSISEVGVLTGRRLRHLRRAPGKFIGIMMNPLVTLLAIGYLFKGSIVVPGSGNYPDYLMAGAAIGVGLASLGPTATGVALDLRSGLVDRLRSLPIARLTVLIGHTLSDLLIAAVSLVVVCAAGVGIGWRVHRGVLPALGGFAVLLVFIYVMLWVGVLLGMLLRDPESIDSIGALLLVSFSFLSNAFLSVQRLPAWIRPVAEWNPVSAVVTTTRRLWGDPVATGHDFPSTHPVIVAAVTLSVLMLVAVPLCLRRYQQSAA